MTNPALSGMVKIGYAKDVEARRQRFNITPCQSTGVFFLPYYPIYYTQTRPEYPDFCPCMPPSFVDRVITLKVPITSI